jgi:D-alanyl-D-alanine carboxypeptidase
MMLCLPYIQSMEPHARSYALPVRSAMVVIAIAGTSVAAQQQDTTLETRVDRVIADQMHFRRIPGLSLGVVRDGRLVLAKGYGEATLEWKAPATPDTVYLLASVTKQFTATAIMLLAGDGRLALDDAVSKYVATAPPWTGITLRHLLTHTAGLKDRFEASADGRLFMDYTTAQMIEAASRTAVDAPAGARWQYSDQGYFLLGMVIEKVSGKRYGDFLRDRVFSPAGMASTTLHDWKAVVPGRADGYSLEGDTLVGLRRRYQFGLVSHYGVQSTVRELARYDAALSAGTILPAARLDEMWTPATLADGTGAGIAGIGYGLGWFLERFRGHREVYHGGSTGTCLYRLPDDRVSVIVLTNLDEIAGSNPCGIARLVAAQYVPAIAIASVPVLEDGVPARTTKLRGVVEGLAKGVVNGGDYTPAAIAIIGQAAKAQQASIAALGPLTAFDLIADDTLASHVVWYRANYRERTVHYRFALDGAGRITSLQMR